MIKRAMDMSVAPLSVALRGGGGAMDVHLPMLGFGTYLCSDSEAEDAVVMALNLGYRHIDTAEGYHNEAGVGRALKRSGVPREEVFITTKLSPGGFGRAEKGYQDTLDSFERSRAALGVEHIDLYIIHHAYAKTQRVNQWRALLDIQASGRARAVGVSNWGIKHFNEIAEAGLAMPAVNQIEYHPMCTHPELMQYMQAHGIAPFGYSSLAPLASWREGKVGASGKHTASDSSDKQQQKEASSSGDGKEGEAAVVVDAEMVALQRCNAAIDSIASKHGVAPAQVLLRWSVQLGVPVIPKSLHEERAAQNMRIFDWALNASDMELLGSMNGNRCFAWPIGNPIDCE